MRGGGLGRTAATANRCASPDVCDYKAAAEGRKARGKTSRDVGLTLVASPYKSRDTVMEAIGG
jgi:hypothetical protein